MTGANCCIVNCGRHRDKKKFPSVHFYQIACNSISLEEPSRYVDMLSHPYYGFAQLRATIMRIVFDPHNSSLSFQRNIQISIERPGVKNCPNPRMFLTLTFLAYGLPQILLHILNEHDEYFQTIYSLLGNSMIRILNIRPTINYYSYQ